MPFFKSPASPSQIDHGSFAIAQELSPGSGQTIVGYVYSDIVQEWWVLRTSSPAYQWPSGPVGNDSSCKYDCIDENSFSSPTEFLNWVLDQASWQESDVQLIECSCNVGIEA